MDETAVSNPAVRPQYLLGYGSLLAEESRVRTWPDARCASPAIVRGIRRGWFDRTPALGPSPTYLGAVRTRTRRALCNGVLFRVSEDELRSFDARESGYTRRRVDPKDVRMLDGTASPPRGDIWFYANRRMAFPSERYPIVYSYVDTCLTGCIEIERAYPLARRADFARTFIRTCEGWTAEHWVNDRIYPRRPFVHQPNAARIDRLLRDVLGRAVFDAIRIRGECRPCSRSALDGARAEEGADGTRAPRASARKNGRERRARYIREPIVRYRHKVKRQ